MKNNNTIWMITIILLIILIIGWLAFSAREDGPANTPEETRTTPPPATPLEVAPASTVESAPGASAPEAPLKEFTVNASNFSFTPKALTVAKGDRVRITVKNEGGTHDLRLDDFGVGTKRLAGGEQDIIEFTTDKAGSFEYYCSIGNHRAMGMVGTLTVTP